MSLETRDGILPYFMWIHGEYFYIWITINAYEAARNLLGFVLPFVTNFCVFLNLLLQTYLEKIWIGHLA